MSSDSSHCGSKCLQGSHHRRSHCITASSSLVTAFWSLVYRRYLLVQRCQCISFSPLRHRVTPPSASPLAPVLLPTSECIASSSPPSLSSRSQRFSKRLAIYSPTGGPTRFPFSSPVSSSDSAVVWFSAAHEKSTKTLTIFVMVCI
jgi:hypothetical protein